MNNTENVLNNSDTPFLIWERRQARKPRKPAQPGDWAFEIQPDPFLNSTGNDEVPF